MNHVAPDRSFMSLRRAADASSYIRLWEGTESRLRLERWLRPRRCRRPMPTRKPMAHGRISVQHGRRVATSCLRVRST